MLSPALALSLLACATAHTPSLGELPADLPPWGAALFAKVGAMEGEITTMKTTIATQTDMLKMQGETIADNSARIQELEARPGGGGRRLDETYNPGVPVHQIFADVVNKAWSSADAGGGGGTSGGKGHRRMQASCKLADLTSRLQAITDECCDEPSEDCTAGIPTSCNAGCAAVLLPFYDDCSDELTEAEAGPIIDAVQDCRATGSFLEQLNLVCSDGGTGCVPACAEPLHGDVLVLTVEGVDSRLICNHGHGLYSWVGAASEGGYLGADIQAFFSAVSSGAAGLYLATLAVAAGIMTDLTIRSGQTVSINGNGGGEHPFSL